MRKQWPSPRLFFKATRSKIRCRYLHSCSKTSSTSTRSNNSSLSYVKCHLSHRHNLGLPLCKWPKANRCRSSSWRQPSRCNNINRWWRTVATLISSSRCQLSSPSPANPMTMATRNNERANTCLMCIFKTHFLTKDALVSDYLSTHLL